MLIKIISMMILMMTKKRDKISDIRMTLSRLGNTITNNGRKKI